MSAIKQKESDKMTKKDLLDLIFVCACDVMPGLANHEIKLDDQWSELGANSMDRADILEMTMESLSLEIPRIELFGAHNIGELVDLIHEKLKSN
jgi:polyketide biosynthesis acyl carrier protein